MLRTLIFSIVFLGFLFCTPAAFAADDKAATNSTYSREEVDDAVIRFFGKTTEGLADVIDKVFQDFGRPSGYIEGGEGGGALIVGLRYGEGTLHLKGHDARKVYWQGPSVGFDWGGNVSKVFTLVYDLSTPEFIYQRFPGVDGSAYIVGGFSVNYQRSGRTVLAPVRTGVGLRLGANVGYLHYTRKKSINPF
jgi:hypothetical protein